MTESKLRDLVAAYREEHSVELDAARLRHRISRSLVQRSAARQRWHWRLGLTAACIGCASVAGASPALSLFHRLASEVLGLGTSELSDSPSANPVASGLPALNQGSPNRGPERLELSVPLHDASSAQAQSDVAAVLSGQVSSSKGVARRAVVPKGVPSSKSGAVHRDNFDEAERSRRFESAFNYQFRKKQYATALQAWDQWLEAGASDALSVDARFYRAVCLLQLGQRPEAERVFRAFAAGTYGEGRRERALTLLRTLTAP